MRFFQKIFIVFALLTANQVCLAADDANPYAVENVPVSVSAKSPTEARNLAVKTVRRDAFIILLTRLSLESKIVNKITDDEIMDMVRSEQIVDEKISGSTYSAAFNITFAKDFVDHILEKKNLQKSEENEVVVEEKRPALIIPVKILQRKILLWESSNDWRAAVNKALDGDDAFKMPVPDIDNVIILNPENVNKISADELEPLFSKYRSDEIYFLLFTHENLSNKATVIVRNVGKVRRAQVKLTFLNSEGLEGQDLMNKVAGKAVEYLQSLKNNEAKLQEKSEQNISLEIPIAQLGDWLMIKNKMETSGFISKIDIESISCDYVKATVSTVSADSNVMELFSRGGFSLAPKTNDIYLLTIKQ